MSEMLDKEHMELAHAAMHWKNKYEKLKSECSSCSMHPVVTPTPKCSDRTEVDPPRYAERRGADRICCEDHQYRDFCAAQDDGWLKEAAEGVVLELDCNGEDVFAAFVAALIARITERPAVANESKPEPEQETLGEVTIYSPRYHPPTE